MVADNPPDVLEGMKDFAGLATELDKLKLPDGNEEDGLIGVKKSEGPPPTITLSIRVTNSGDPEADLQKAIELATKAIEEACKTLKQQKEARSSPSL